MEIFFFTCNGNLINYKAKKACYAQLLFHYILITLQLCCCNILTLLQHLLTNISSNGHFKNILKLYCILEKFSFIKTNRLHTFP